MKRQIKASTANRNLISDYIYDDLLLMHIEDEIIEEAREYAEFKDLLPEESDDELSDTAQLNDVLNKARKAYADALSKFI